jgi:SSS family solute:Na+ symporter
MHWIDVAIFAAYMLVMLGVGFHFMRRHRGGDDYYVGGRDMGAWHIGLSVVATDVGGGFSIGLGGLGFAIGLSGSWMLLTGLVGAWLSAVLLIPRIKGNRAFARALTFPDVFAHFFNRKVALLAGIISAVGYIGFTASQILAGAKLAAGTFAHVDRGTALLVMGAVVVLYTVMGGMKAVIYTDTIQWIVLLGGLVFIGLPVAFVAVGGFPALRHTLRPEMLTLTNVSWQRLVDWAVTIVPIWFVGMTLYQRIYASRDERTAKRAWYIAGLFEWPVMAFLGVSLGLLARVAADQGRFGYLGAADVAATDPEAGLPMLLRTVLPAGLMGLVMSAYFSAVLSTADSCLMAASGNVVTDILSAFRRIDPDDKRFVRLSQLTTLGLGVLALLLAGTMTQVLDLMLYSYAFMVSGLFVPMVGALFWRRRSSGAALAAMLCGGGTTVLLELGGFALPLGLDGNVYGIAVSAVVYVVGTWVAGTVDPELNAAAAP